MKTPALFCLHFSLLFLLFGAGAAAQTGAAGEAEAQKTEERIAAVQRDTLNKYDEALAELQLTFQKAADLEGALAVRAERQRAAEEQSLSDKNFVTEPKSLRALQTQTVARAQELNAQLIAETLPRLVELKKQLTVAGKLDDAVAVRSAIERLQNAHVPLVRADPALPVAVDSLLVAYGADRARADKVYKGQRIAVRGIVGGFRPDPADGRHYQVFLTGNTGSGWVQATFLAGDYRFREERAAFNTPVLVITGKGTDSAGVRLQKGTALEVRGLCEGWDEVVRLVRCELVR